MSDKCPWCGAEIDHDYESGSREWKCGTIGRFDGKVIVGTDCVRSVVADRDFKAARIAELEAELAATKAERDQFDKWFSDVDGVVADHLHAVGRPLDRGANYGEAAFDLPDELKRLREENVGLVEACCEHQASAVELFGQVEDLKEENARLRSTGGDSLNLATDVWIAHWNGFVSASRNIKEDDCPYSTAVFRTAWILGTACGGFSRLEKQDFDSLDARSKRRMSLAKRLSAKLRSLRSRLGADDDDAVEIDEDWLESRGQEWQVSNGFLRVEWEGDRYVIRSIANRGGWFLHLPANTRGDVRALVAALGEREGGE